MYPTLWRNFAGFREDDSWSPSIEVIEAKNDVKVLAEIPGLNKDDIHVSVDGNLLTVQGEKKQAVESTENGIVRSERVYGNFYRALTLPKTVDANNIKATYQNGVLELTLPKIEEAKPKQISISVN
jgi:HSP20 family protein